MAFVNVWHCDWFSCNPVFRLLLSALVHTHSCSNPIWRLLLCVKCVLIHSVTLFEGSYLKDGVRERISRLLLSTLVHTHSCSIPIWRLLLWVNCVLVHSVTLFEGSYLEGWRSWTCGIATDSRVALFPNLSTSHFLGICDIAFSSLYLHILLFGTTGCGDWFDSALQVLEVLIYLSICAQSFQTCVAKMLRFGVALASQLLLLGFMLALHAFAIASHFHHNFRSLHKLGAFALP